MQQQTVHLFVFPTLADWEPAFAIAGINHPLFENQSCFRVKTVGITKEPVTTIGGITILPDITLDELEPSQSAMLILPGSDDWIEGKYTEVVIKAQAFLAAHVPVAAICGATVALARAGMLNSRLHTSNDLQYLKMTSGYVGEQFYQKELAVTDSNLITANGVAPLDFAYHIFKKLAIYNDQKLDAWYNLYKTGDAAYFYALQAASTQSTQ